MSNTLNRQERRKLSRKEFQKVHDDAINQVSAAFLGIPIKVLHEKYGWTADECGDFALKMVDEYNANDDYEKLQIEIFDQLGIGLVKV